MNASSINTSKPVDELVIQVLNTTKKDLRKIRKEDPRMFTEFLDFLRASQLEAQRVISISKIAIDRLHSI